MKGKLLAFGVSLLAVATIGVVQLQTQALDGSRDCDRFAIIRCGALNGEELRAEYDSNGTSDANGDRTTQGDIKQVFSGMGISRADLAGSFKSGVVHKNGTVEVDGKVVATDARMAARGLGGNQISGTNAQKISVSAMSDSQTALVKLDQNGRFLFAVMKPCGNPVVATPTKPQPQPKAECTSLDVVRQARDKYLVTAHASAENGATIKSYTFKVTKAGTTVYDNTYKSQALEQSVVYQKLEAGEYKVHATVNTSEGAKSGPNCEGSFTVKDVTVKSTPAIDITKFVDTDKKYMRVNANVEFNYTIAVKNTGDVDLENVVVTDTPDRAITLVSVTPPSGKIENNTFMYTIPKLLKGETRTFVLTAKVPTAQAGRLVNTVCVDAPAVPGNPDKCDKAEVEVPPTPVPGKTEVCVLADKSTKQITEEDYAANTNLYSKDFSDCEEVEATETPAELPQTGPTETIMSIVGAMSLVGSTAYYVASRRHA